MHYRNLLAAVKTAPHPDDISPTGVHVRYSIYYIHNATINSNCRSCVCRSQSQCRKEFKKLTSCSRDVALTLLWHTHRAHTPGTYIQLIHTHSVSPHSVVLYTQSSPDASSAYFSDLLHYQTILVPGSGGEGLWPNHNIATQNTWTRRSSGSKLVFCLSYFTSFIGNDIWMFQSDTCDAAETDADSSTKSFFPFSPPSLAALPTASVLIVTLFRLRFRRIVTHFLRLPTVSQSLLLLPSGLTGVSSCPMCGLWTQLGHCDFSHWPHNLPLIAVLWPKFAACFMAANSWLAITNKNG